MKRDAIFREFENMEKWYDCECQIAGMADIPCPDFYSFLKESFKRIAERQKVTYKEVKSLYREFAK